mgnify:CR=1 FL=1
MDPAPTPADVAVLLLSWNQSRFAAETVRSVADQTGVTIEVVAVDNGSTDGSADVVAEAARSHGLTLDPIRNDTNRGISTALNQALALTTAPFVVPFACDDVMLPGRLATQAGLLRALPTTVAGVCGVAVVCDADGVDVAGEDDLPWRLGTQLVNDPVRARLGLLGADGPLMPATMLRRSTLDALGGFDESYPFEDLPLYYGAVFGLGQTFHHHPEPVTRYRWHGGNGSNNLVEFVPASIRCRNAVPADRLSPAERSARDDYVAELRRNLVWIRRADRKDRSLAAWTDVRTRCRERDPGARRSAVGLLTRRGTLPRVRARALVAALAPAAVARLARGQVAP